MEESGWKLVHGDVFRPPQYPMILSSLLGSGIQLFCMILIVICEWAWGDWGWGPVTREHRPETERGVAAPPPAPGEWGKSALLSQTGSSMAAGRLAPLSTGLWWFAAPSELSGSMDHLPRPLRQQSHTSVL